MEMKQYQRVMATVDLDAIAENLRAMKENVRPGTKLIGVIKADGYGHGAVPIGRMMEQMEFVWGYAVATVEEGYALRKAGLTKPILLLGPFYDGQEKLAVKYGLTCSIFRKDAARALNAAAEAADCVMPVHLKFDTGMSRIGFRDTDEAYEEIKEIARFSHLRIEGAFSHFARADEIDKTNADGQLALYKKMVKRTGIDFRYLHISASAGIVDLSEANLDLARAGIALYGLYPSDDVRKEKVVLQPALSLRSHVVHVKEIPEGTPVSYGGTYVAEGTRRVATIPVGYGDGYPRTLSNCGHVLINGKVAKILGRVCMDMFMVDVTDIPECNVGSAVTLIGSDGDEKITVEDLTRLSGRFHYEILCDLNKRIPRVYLKDGKVSEVIDYADGPAVTVS